ncbi:ABC transporter ATP-binding protein [Shimia sp.]|uniref:ABC transporter ATP-binding protein n=1 Tax=Shimia sp. TaxID=1954381 RepID=UPI003297BA46
MALVDVMRDMQEQQTILDVRDLKVSFKTPRGHVYAVNGIDFQVTAGEALGILGESGSGKSVSVGAMMGLLESPPAMITGSADYRGTELLNAPASVTRKIHGDRISMVYQDAITSLNPGLKIGTQIGELFKVHRPQMSRGERRAKAVELMEAVGIHSASERVDSYPHEFSGGMNQRIMIALGIALGPDILIADEPTTALDVTVQAQIMKLLGDLRRQSGMALILITHDIGLVAENTDRLMVMYGGRPVETGPTAKVIDRPSHPYTIGLMNSIPQVEMKGQKLVAISGSPPKLSQLPQGCVFAPRCPLARDVCRSSVPEITDIGQDHFSACHFAEEVAND